MRAVAVRTLVLVLAVGLAPTAAGGDPRTKPIKLDVTGTYDSNFAEVRLVQHGAYVEGEYVCCGGGTITGKLVGRVLTYHWAQADGSEGHGVWRVTGVRSLRGTWGSGDSADDGGEWNLDRVDDIAR